MYSPADTPNSERLLHDEPEHDTRDQPLHAADRLALYRSALARYGEAFLAYLTLDLPAPEAGDEIADFAARHVGSYPDRSAFVEQQLHDRGWRQGLEALCRDTGILPTDVRWDTVVLWEQFSDDLVVCELPGGVHVFRP